LFGKLFRNHSSGSNDVIGSDAADAIGLGRFRNWTTGNIGPRLRFGGDEGVMVWGRNGSGKDTRLLVPLLLQATGSSMFVIDVKGELAAISAPFRRTLGPTVIINPYGVLVDELPDLASDGFNPLAALDPASPSFTADCGYIADAVIMSEKGDSGNAKHFIESANAMLTLSIMCEVIQAKNEGRVPVMTKVRELICTASGFDFVTKQEYGWPVLARDMVKKGATVIANLASQFTLWNNEKEGIASDAKRQTKAFDDSEIAADLMRGCFDLREMKRRPVTVYVILPPLQMQRQARYLRLLVDAALRAVMRPRKPGEPKCVFVLNEMATLGRLDVLSQVWGAVRGYGIQLIPVLQSLSQLEAIYGDKDAATFVEQAGVIASFGAANIRTAEWLSTRCGDTTAVLASYNQGTSQNGGGIGSSSGLGWSQQKVPAVTPHEMCGLKDGNMVQFAAGLADFVSAYAPPYWMIDQCQQRARANPYYQARNAA